MLNDFYQEIEKIKAEAKKNYKPEKIRTDKSQEISSKTTSPQYLINFNNIEIDPIWLEEYFKKIVFTLEKFEEDDKPSQTIRDGFKQKNLDLKVLVKKVFNSDSNYLDRLAQKIGMEKEELHFLGLELGKPVFELYAEKLKGKIDLDNWGKGFCPVCGSPPALSYLRKEEGKRILWCQFCETQWSFMRLKCPFCSNEDQKNLRYFFTEENDPHRVYVCDKCKKYVKTIDLRKLEKPEDLDLGW